MVGAPNRVRFFRASRMSLRAGPMRQGRTLLGPGSSGLFILPIALSDSRQIVRTTKGAPSGDGRVDVIRSEPGRCLADPEGGGVVANG
jgi:hypothetical protein